MASYVEEFERQIVPKYRNYYVSYTQLLDAIDLLKDRQQETDSSGGLLKGLILPKDFTFGDTTAMYGLLEQRPEVRFVSLLQHEVSKLNHFTQLEVRTLLSVLRQIHKKLDRIASGIEEESVSRQVFPSFADETDVGLSHDEKVALIRAKLRDQSEEILVLEEYITINLATLKRLAREFDNRFDDRPPISSWFLSNLVDESFSKVPFDGLFSLVATMYRKCAPRCQRVYEGPWSEFWVPKAHSLRVKLILADQAGLDLPPVDHDVVPTRLNELAFLKLSTSCQRIELCLEDIRVLEWRNRSIDAVLLSGEVRLHVSLPKPPQGPTRVCQFEETYFVGATFIDQIRSQIVDDLTPYFSLSPASLEGERNSLLRIQTTSPVFDAVAMYLGEEALDLCSPPAEVSTPTPRPLMRHSASTFSVPGQASPRVATLQVDRSPQQAAVTAMGLIYPKNFMANERSVLAWISACAVQGGIGVAFLGKPGYSLIGTVICLVSLWFLWWSVTIFVRRFRQLKASLTQNDYLFYSMDLPTAFGVCQLVILGVQTLCMLLAT